MQADPKHPASPAPAPAPDHEALQGEGNYDATRRHRASVESFVESGQVEDAARDAAPKTPLEKQALLDAEQIGESHSKGEDPALKHAPQRKP